jgi:hypothetical protein
MKKKIFNKTTIVTGPRSAHGCSVSINPNGNFSFSAELSATLQLTKTGVEFIQDEDRPTDWYLELSTAESSLPLRDDKGGVKLQCAFLAKEILKSLGLDSAHRFQVATEPVEGNMFAILTKSATPTRSKKED